MSNKKIVLIILLCLSTFQSVSQSTESLVSSVYVDDVSISTLTNDRYVFTYGRSNQMLSGFNFDNYESIRSAVDGVFSKVYLFDSYNESWSVLEFASDSTEFTLLGRPIVDIEEEVFYMLINAFEESGTYYSKLLKFNFEMEVLDTFEIDEPNKAFMPTGINDGYLYGLEYENFFTYRLALLDKNFSNYVVSSLNPVDVLPDFQFIYNPETSEYIYDAPNGVKYFLDNNLELLNSCNALFITGQESIEPIVKNEGTVKIYNGGSTVKYDFDIGEFIDMEIVYTWSPENCDFDTIYSYVPPDSSDIEVSSLGFDFIYEDYIYNTVYYKSGNFCNILTFNSCVSQVSITSIDSNGELNWRKYIGDDAYYYPAQTFATVDSGVIVLFWTFNQMDNDHEYDAHYIKFDKDGNQEPNFFSPFLSTEVPEFEVFSALVYPNPTSDYLYIQSDRNYWEVKIQIFDMNGRLVFCEEVNPSDKMDIRSLPSGTYTFILEGDAKELRSGKFVKG